jgi:hypothetical protein
LALKEADLSKMWPVARSFSQRAARRGPEQLTNTDMLIFGRRRETLSGVAGPADLDIKQSIQMVRAGLKDRLTGW